MMVENTALLKERVISYTYYSGKIYLNITNRCSNNCNFCIRNYTDELAGYYLWLDSEPDVDEIVSSVLEEVERQGGEEPEEVIFCGYGEPMCRPYVIIEVLKRLKDIYVNCKFRINTNGQSALLNDGKTFLPELSGLLDAISISLNAHNREAYEEICEPVYKDKAFSSILKFAREAVECIPEVILSVVGVSGVDIDKCRKIAEDMGAGFRVR